MATRKKARTAREARASKKASKKKRTKRRKKVSTVAKPIGRRSKLTPECQTVIAECIKYGLTDTEAAQLAGIARGTLYRWLEQGEKANTGQFNDFYNAYKNAQPHSQIKHLRAIEKSVFEGYQTTKEIIEYESGEIVELADGTKKLRAGKVKSIRREIQNHPPSIKGSIWFLERLHAKKWGRKLPERDAPVREGTPTIVYTLPDNGRMRDMKKIGQGSTVKAVKALKVGEKE